jgi:putative endonuclease
VFFVYLLKSLKDESFYIGCTNNLNRRLKEDNSGENRSTKARTPFKLIYYESYLSEKDAKRREENLKLHGRAFTQLRKRLEETINIA